MIIRDSVIVMLKQPSTLDLPAHPYNTLAEGDQEVRWDEYIWVQDVDSLYREFVAKGAGITHKPYATEYGCK
jgi:hypothetical protein